jgi:hypothetical protein
VNLVINSQGVTAMSDNPANQTNNLADSSIFDEINWFSLWQASGNDWTWMLQQEVADRRNLKPEKQTASSHQPTYREIFLTSILVLLTLWLQTCMNSRKDRTHQEVYPPAISLEQWP